MQAYHSTDFEFSMKQVIRTYPLKHCNYSLPALLIVALRIQNLWIFINVHFFFFIVKRYHEVKAQIVEFGTYHNHLHTLARTEWKDTTTSMQTPEIVFSWNH
ncbi:hypothetical protein DPMN_077762 [Dreissena polymorpha]|uniref:Transmembrane protein n=1 Tax=Dreissena polymorpha TaxID=45954 RepID=A0A9D4BPX6_DREPO|nr:hypothetical protein DPMN_077762 [Dreissena polymorpha]